MPIEFPLRIDEGSTQFPSNRCACCVCDRKLGEIEGFIRLTVGAILFDDESRMNGGPTSLMDTLFKFWFHGPHPIIGQSPDGRFEIGMDNAECHLVVIDRVRHGQTDILFCSTACIRRFFEDAMKELDRRAIDAKKELEERSNPDR